MRRWDFGVVLFIVACLSSGMTSSACAQSRGELTVRANGFASELGRAVAKLYRQDEDVLGREFVRAHADIRAGAATFHFDDLPYGNYAVVVFHDKNDNGEIDHRLGFPAEPLGFSNDFSLGVLSGLPTFDKLRFRFAPDARSIEVTVK